LHSTLLTPHLPFLQCLRSDQLIWHFPCYIVIYIISPVI
jgi:hypothetical protein